MLGIRFYHNTSIDLFLGDITEFSCDVMVTAANEMLAGGGGVDGAIHQVGGPSIAAACRQIGPIKTGTAVLTTAGQLPAKHLVHAVGPIWKNGSENEANLLQSAYLESLNRAHEVKVRHIAIPAISTGVFGFPLKPAAKVAMAAVKLFCDQNPETTVKRITFILFQKEAYQAFQDSLFASFPETDEGSL